MKAEETSEHARAIRAGDRRALARAITLVESTRDDHRAASEALLAALRTDAEGTVRLGISGAPGVGKSTFIEAFGLHALDRGRRLAVLAVDPSSVRSGGAILGDKTRMVRLSRHERAFVRPSPSAGTLGGVARRTREAVLLCEAAGYDTVIVETVGAGQSEIAVRDLVDVFLLLVAPGAGDELQGIKRGIVEAADLVVVNKTDGALTAAAGQTRAQFQSALRLLRQPTPGWTPRVLGCSALERRGMDELWEAVEAFVQAVGEGMARRRTAQAVAWMWAEVRESLDARLRAAPAVSARLADIERRVADGCLAPGTAARELVEAFLADRRTYAETRGKPKGDEER